MPTRPDLRQITTDIRAALADLGRDELVDILAQVFREYVVEGPPPLPVPPATIDEMAGLSFAEVIAALQLRLDVPELSLFEVEGDVVRVRVRGELVPLRSSARGDAGSPPAGDADAGGAPERRAPAPGPRAPGVQVVETAVERMPPPVEPTGRDSVDEAVARGRGDLAGIGAPAAPTPAPPRPRGISIGGRAMATPPASAPASPDRARGPAPGRSRGAAPAGGSEAARDKAQGEGAPESGGDSAEPGSGEDIASIRFSLLELD